MSTLTEIETAVDRLPLAEKEMLLRHLESSLRGQRSVTAPGPRDDWMRRLDELRASIGTGRQNLSSEQLTEEGREERN